MKRKVPLRSTLLIAAPLLLAALPAFAAGAMTIEAILGTDRPFDERIHGLRPHPGQSASAANLRALLHESAIVDDVDFRLRHHRTDFDHDRPGGQQRGQRD